jgi:hypothetical protein
MLIGMLDMTRDVLSPPLNPKVGTMAVETNVALDLGGMMLPALYVNRVQVLASGPNLRMAFGEGFAGSNVIYRSAVTMTIQDAKEVAGAILATIAAQEAAAANPELPRG